MRVLISVACLLFEMLFLTWYWFNKMCWCSDVRALILKRFILAKWSACHEKERLYCSYIDCLFFLSFRWFLPPKLPILTVTIEICWKTTYQPSFITISAFLSKDYHSSIYCNASCYGYGIYMLLIVLLLLTLITLINSSLHWIYCTRLFLQIQFLHSKHIYT